MHKFIPSAALCVALIGVVVQAGGWAQGYAELQAVSGVDGYVGEVYTEPPVSGSQYVFIEGEPLVLRVQVLNHGVETRVLLVPDGLSVETMWSHQALRDGEPVALALGRPIVNGVSYNRSVVQSSLQRTYLDPHDSITWKFALTERLRPGVYRVKWMTKARDENGRQKWPLSYETVFEVRASEGLEFERMRRDAWRAVRGGQGAEARRILETMLKVNPASYGALTMLASLSESEENREEATALRQRARVAVLSGADALFVAKRPAEEVQRLIKALNPQ